MTRKTDPNKKYGKLKDEYLKCWSQMALYQDTLKMVLDDPRVKEVAEDIYNKLNKLIPALDRKMELERVREVLDE